MKIQLTGMSPRMASERAREQVTFARTLHMVLTELGHDVHRAPGAPNVDLVIVGVTSPISPGASYALVGLEAIGRALRDGTPLLLFVDDPALDKTRSGAASAMRNMDRLYTDYLMSKRVSLMRDPDDVQRERILTAVVMLAGEMWPPTLLPMHPWASAAVASKRLGIFSEVVPLDVSAPLGPGEMPEPSTFARGPLWLDNRRYSDQVLDHRRVTWPVIPVDSAMLPNPVRVYAAAKGVHQGLTARMPGWWTPTPLQVAQARTVYLCETEESRLIGTDSPYYLTPDTVEALDDGVHADLAEAQAAHLEDVTWNLATLSSALMDSIGRATSSERPVMSSPPSRTS